MKTTANHLPHLLRKLSGSVALIVLLQFVGCTKEKDDINGCRFTFRGKVYSGTYAPCFDVEGIVGDRNLQAYPSYTTTGWYLTLSDGSSSETPTIRFEDPSICEYIQFAQVANVSFSDNKFTFSGSGFSNFAGTSCDGEIVGECVCTETH